nr:MAG TPA: hypothetical protein [Caudoviricetes sp.]
MKNLSSLLILLFLFCSNNLNKFILAPFFILVNNKIQFS